MHFDDSENWTLSTAEAMASEDATDFLSVAIHEIGHVLGLLHSDDNSAVMFPSYRGVQHKLEADDIDGLKELYDKSSNAPAYSAELPATEEEATESPTSAPANCYGRKIDAATCTSSGCYFFIGMREASSQRKKPVALRKKAACFACIKKWPS